MLSPEEFPIDEVGVRCNKWLQVFSSCQKYFLSLHIKKVISGGGEHYELLLKNPLQYGSEHLPPQNLAMCSTVGVELDVPVCLNNSQGPSGMVKHNELISMNLVLVFIS